MRARRLTAAALLSTVLALASATAIQAGAPRFFGATIGAFSTTYAAPGAIAEVPDPLGGSRRVLRVTVHDRDVYPVTPTDNPRASLVSPSLLQPGAEIWLATEFLVPVDYPRIPPGGWVTLASFYGPPYRSSSPWQLELSGRHLQWQRNATYGFDVPFEQRLQRGQWTSVLVHERFARRGFVELWIDGRKVRFFDGGTFNPHHHAPTFRLKMETRDRSNDYGPNSARIGQYRKAGMFNVGTLYFGPLRIGPTRASVVP
ncbi:MAG TPA: heparin lyase I family protein [Solirubrobacterales bacterium]|nr:heparin lyase I family protein [Solirubrobacterales bacterium]